MRHCFSTCKRSKTIKTLDYWKPDPVAKAVLRVKFGNEMVVFGERGSPMAELFLGTGEHTLFSDDQWYLIIPPGSPHPFLECRFQTDAPDRTGYPTWTQTEFCVSHGDEVAVLRLPLPRIPGPGDPNRFSSVPDAIWKKTVDDCGKLRSELAGSEPEQP
jgi:hypothetical protein